MPDLQALISAVSPRPRITELIGDLAPPPRFTAKSFESYHPRHPTQAAAVERLRRLAGELNTYAGNGLGPSGCGGRCRSREGDGIYLDGGFGVGKTHLLAALWNAVREPKSYLTFDELVYLLGYAGIREAQEGLRGQRLIAVDEWELDDPGNLKLALAFLRGALKEGVRVAVTSNTLPIDLGAGRFSQKDFQGEIEELAGAFEVIRIQGDDYRHRHFELDPGGERFRASHELRGLAQVRPDEVLHVGLDELLSGLERVHPIRYPELIRPVNLVLVEGLRPIDQLPQALRWVHFIDNVYEAAIGFSASSAHSLGDLFPREFIEGPFGKKLSAASPGWRSCWARTKPTVPVPAEAGIRWPARCWTTLDPGHARVTGEQ